MSDPDVVAELDRQLLHWHESLLERARYEIVRLRKTVERQQAVLLKGHAEVRAEALEEAARVCEGGYTTGSTASTLRAIAAAIRALKDKA